MCFIGVEVEQEKSAPPPKKNPGSAPAKQGLWKGPPFKIYDLKLLEVARLTKPSSLGLRSEATFSPIWTCIRNLTWVLYTLCLQGGLENKPCGKTWILIGLFWSHDRWSLSTFEKHYNYTTISIGNHMVSVSVVIMENLYPCSFKCLKSVPVMVFVWLPPFLFFTFLL